MGFGSEHQIKSYLSKLRRGIPSNKKIKLGHGDNEIEVLVALLSNDEMIEVEDMVIEKYGEKKQEGDTKARNLYYNSLLAYKCTRVPDNVYLNIADTYEEFSEAINFVETEKIIKTYNELLINETDKIEFLTEEQLDDLVDFFGITHLEKLYTLNTVSLIHLRNLYLSLEDTIVKEKVSQMDKSSTYTSLE